MTGAMLPIALGIVSVKRGKERETGVSMRRVRGRPRDLPPDQPSRPHDEDAACESFCRHGHRQHRFPETCSRHHAARMLRRKKAAREGASLGQQQEQQRARDVAASSRRGHFLVRRSQKLPWEVAQISFEAEILKVEF